MDAGRRSDMGPLPKGLGWSGAAAASRSTTRGGEQDVHAFILACAALGRVEKSTLSCGTTAWVAGAHAYRELHFMHGFHMPCMHQCTS